MRLLHHLILAAALTVAAPAVAQNTATNAAANNQAPLNAMTSMPAGPTTAGGQPTTLPQQPTTPSPTVTTNAEMGERPIVAEKTGFPWGVLGLVGLIGLFGRRRAS